jgi:hypothetical protein
VKKTAGQAGAAGQKGVNAGELFSSIAKTKCY